ncbi:MAG: 5-formyltetrahydrofolate cyclo-ligase [Amphiplicatus sp.]
MFPPIAPFLDPKRILREKMKAERRAAAKVRPDAARHAARNFLEAIAVPDGAVVALYHPIRDEIDTTPLAEALAARGVALALPVVARRAAPLDFRRYRPGDALVKGAFGVRGPDEKAETLAPDIIIAPLLAFDRAGGRLGYGGGYYDRSLAALRADRPVVAVGYAYGAQEVDALPLSPLDQRLDWIITEREAIRVGKA